MKNYYVTVIRAPQRVGWLAGPFATHQEALDMVTPARKLATELDAFTCFDFFGTACSQNDRPGVLNGQLGLNPTARPVDLREGSAEDLSETFTEAFGDSDAVSG